YYPTGIDTEGLENENKMKPQETKTIEVIRVSSMGKIPQSGSATYSPDVVADALLIGLRKGRFAITNEAISELMRACTNGTTAPRNNLLLDIILTILAIFISVPFAYWMDGVVSKSKKNKGQ